MNGIRLAEGLRALAANARTVPVPVDLWRRGVRRRRRIAAAAAVVVLVLLGVPVALVATDPDGLSAAAGGPAVPARVYAPRLLEPTAQRHPPGPAVILVGGVGAFEGNDLPSYGFESRSLVVGANGTYRLIREQYGPGATLSPDGRYAASGNVLEGVSAADVAVSVLDLETGDIRVYPGGRAVAWLPDGQRMLIQDFDGKMLKLLDLRTGATTGVIEAEPGQLRRSWLASFTSDSRRMALQLSDTLYVVDLDTGSTRKLADLGSRRRLAGDGGWLPDGRTIAVLDMQGCEVDCDSRALDSRMWTVSYLDADTGRAATGPRLDGVVAIGVRLLGWQRDGAAVLARHDASSFIHNGPLRHTWSETSFEAIRNVELIRLTPGGGRQRLVELPPGTRTVDVPRNVIEAGVFGGPSMSAPEGWLRNAIGPATPLVITFWPALVPVGLVLLLGLVWLIRRMRDPVVRGETLPAIGHRLPR